MRVLGHWQRLASKKSFIGLEVDCLDHTQIGRNRGAADKLNDITGNEFLRGNDLRDCLTDDSGGRRTKGSDTAKSLLG